MEDSINYVLNEIKEHGPFDGVLSFSQGSIFFRHLYRVTHDIDSASYADVKDSIPRFIISVAGPYFPKMLVEYKGENFSQEKFTFPIESLHIYGEIDEYKAFMTEHELFTKDPVVVTHAEGHKFPRAFTDDDYEKLTAFVKKQYVAKFGSDEGFALTLDKFNF